MAAKYLSKWRPGFLEQFNDAKNGDENKTIAGAGGQNGATAPVTA
jgi:hypothetical protein